MASSSHIRDHYVILVLSSENPNPDAVWPALRAAIERLFVAALGQREAGPAGTVMHAMVCHSATRGTPDGENLRKTTERLRAEYPLVDATAADLLALTELVTRYIPESYQADEDGDSLSSIKEWLDDITSLLPYRYARAVDMLGDEHNLLAFYHAIGNMLMLPYP